jgi:hypothetical protein
VRDLLDSGVEVAVQRLGAVFFFCGLFRLGRSLIGGGGVFDCGALCQDLDIVAIGINAIPRYVKSVES